MNFKEGDRIEMVFMGNDPNPILAGTRGTVISVDKTPWNDTQVGVKWDNGRTLSVLLPEDKIVLIDKSM
jgi:hypothetical protein